MKKNKVDSFSVVVQKCPFHFHFSILPHWKNFFYFQWDAGVVSGFSQS